MMSLRALTDILVYPFGRLRLQICPISSQLNPNCFLSWTSSFIRSPVATMSSISLLISALESGSIFFKVSLISSHFSSVLFSLSRLNFMLSGQLNFLRIAVNLTDFCSERIANIAFLSSAESSVHNPVLPRYFKLLRSARSLNL
jgi:hypothetical protein